MSAGSPQVHLFTLGYENLSVRRLVAVLQEHGIRRLGIDSGYRSFTCRD